MSEKNAPKEPVKDAPLLSFATRSLSNRKPTRFNWKPNSKERAYLARVLDLQAVNALSLIGELRPLGRQDFELKAELIADITQSCVITLAPVPAKISESVERRYVINWEEPTADEFEISAEDISEPMPETIDIREVAREALSLALPPYPRAENAELGEAVFAEAGTEAMKDEDLRPFAALASLLKNGNQGDGNS